MSASLEKGLTEQETFESKKLRGETKKGQRPVARKEKCSSDRGSFKFK